jgi:hypothetical protein
MFFKVTAVGRNLFALLTALLCAAELQAAPAGPTLRLDYGRGEPQANPVGKFMYFVPLISPDPSVIFTNAGNTQCARVLSFASRTNATEFRVTCKFEFTGTGALQNVFDLTRRLQARASSLKDGDTVKHQLTAISVSGSGHGSVEVEGTLADQKPVVKQVIIRFDDDGMPSPVSVDLKDYVWHNGDFSPRNERVARVNSLTFRRTDATPKMEVSLGAIKAKNARSGLWQNFWGGLKAMTANLFLPPLKITAEGQQTMLDFGQALVLQNSEFTFPHATRLTGILPASS